MGWCGGSRLFEEIIKATKSQVKSFAGRECIYLRLIPAFEDMDCDTLQECVDLDPAFNSAFRHYHPDYFD